MHRGFVAIWRKIEDWKYKDNPKMFSLWIHLLLNMNHKDKHTNGILVKKGQLLTGLHKLKEITGVPKSTIERYLKTLENENQIGQQKTNKFRIISIINYKRYLFLGSKMGIKWESNGKQMGTTNNYNNYNNYKINSIVGIFGKKEFDAVWNLYPNKDGKKKAFNYFKASVKTQDDLKNLKIALNNYLNSERVKKGYIKNGSTWFNNWKDWIDFKEVKHGKNIRNFNETDYSEGVPEGFFKT